MSWQAFIAISVVLVSFRVLLTRLLAVRNTDKHAAFALNAAALTVLYVCGLVYVAFHPVDVVGALKHWPYLLLGGLLYGLANALMLKLFAYVDSAVGTVISTISVLFTTIFAWILIGERLTGLQTVGALLLLPSVCYVVLLNRKRTKARKTWQIIALGLTYTALAGLGNVNEKFMLSHMSIPTYLLLGWGAQAGVSWLLALTEPHSLKSIKDKELWPIIFGLGVLTAAGGLTFIEAQVRSNNVSLVTAIACFRLIIITALGWLLLKERAFFWRKVLVAIIAAFGVLLMVL